MRKFMLAAAAAFTMAFGFTAYADTAASVEVVTDVTAQPADEAGTWSQVGQQWFYYHADGSLAKNEMITDGGTKYYMGATAAMVSTSWVSWDGGWYYAGNNGAIAADQILELNTDKYYVYPDGHMAVNEWAQCDGDWYYLQNDGTAVKNKWYNIDGEDYYFLKNAKMARNATVPGGGHVGDDGRKTN